MKLKAALLAVIYRLPGNLSRRALFLYHRHRLLRVRNPMTFSEKVNWRILKDRRDILAWTCDKLAMKDYASKVQGATVHRMRVPRTLWFGTDVRELASAKLPEHWVLKPNHRSGLVFFGRGQPDIPELEKIARDWFRPFEGAYLHEWAYLKARPLLLVEELLGIPGSPPSDYKFFVFDGEVAVIQVHADRHTAHSVRWYLPDWTPAEVSLANFRLSPLEAEPPGNLETMIAIAGELGRPFDFMRVDLYSVGDDVFFGELTPYPASGIIWFVPGSFDDELGAKWTLPKASR